MNRVVIIVLSFFAFSCSASAQVRQLTQDLFAEASNTAITAHTPDSTSYPTAESWNIYSGTPDSVDAASDTYIAAGLSPHTVLLTSRTDFTFAVKIKITTDDTAGVSIRVKDSDDFIFVELLSAQNRYRLGKRVAGTNTFIDSATVTINTGTFYVILVDVNGATVSATFDGGNEITGTISDHRQEGRIGLWHPSGNATYDSVEVNSQTAILDPRSFYGLEMYMQSDSNVTTVSDSITQWDGFADRDGDQVTYVASNNRQPYLKASGFGDHSTMVFHGGSTNSTYFSGDATTRTEIAFIHQDSSSLAITFITEASNPDDLQYLFVSNGASASEDGTQIYHDDRSGSSREDRVLEIIRSAANNNFLTHLSADDDFPAQTWATMGRSYHNGTDPDYQPYNDASALGTTNDIAAPGTVSSSFNAVIGDRVGGSADGFNGEMFLIVGWSRVLLDYEWTGLQTWIDAQGSTPSTTTRKRVSFIQ